MRLSERTRDGIKILMDVAIHKCGNSPLPLSEIAPRQGFSRAYLVDLITPLSSAGIIRYVGGSSGGVILVKKPGEIDINQLTMIMDNTPRYSYAYSE
jgi:Rrf2 family protein